MRVATEIARGRLLPLYKWADMARKWTLIHLKAKQRKHLSELRRRERGRVASATNATFGALPRLEVPIRDEWDRA